MRPLTLGLLVVIIAALAGCGRSAPKPTATIAPPAAATATPQTVPTDSQTTFISPVSPLAYDRPGFPLDTGRSQSAMAGLPVATELALQWSPDAYFLGIQPSFIMERNIPYMPSEAGWFYRFGRPADALEFYVQVADGEASGTTEAEAVQVEVVKPPTLDPSLVKLDSDAAKQVYLNSISGQPPRDSELDYALSMDTDLGKPIWWIYDLDRGEDPVLAIDAVDGQVLPMQ